MSSVTVPDLTARATDVCVMAKINPSPLIQSHSPNAYKIQMDHLVDCMHRNNRPETYRKRPLKHGRP
jgi:hypothetical protein